jgi:hypothetical protein
LIELRKRRAAALLAAIPQSPLCDRTEKMSNSLELENEGPRKSTSCAPSIDAARSPKRPGAPRKEPPNRPRKAPIKEPPGRRKKPPVDEPPPYPDRSEPEDPPPAGDPPPKRPPARLMTGAMQGSQRK